MSEEISIFSNDREFKVSREALGQCSSYFRAALSSGMVESTSQQFKFPSLNSHQLALMVRSIEGRGGIELSDLDIGKSDDDACATSIECIWEGRISSLLQFSETADYFLMDELLQSCTSLLRRLLDIVVTCDQSSCFNPSHTCQVFSLVFHYLASLGPQARQSPVACLLYQQTLKHPCLFLNPSRIRKVFNSRHLSFLIEALSSDHLCIKSEDIALMLIISWFKFSLPCENAFLERLLDCIRPGLLSWDGRLKFVNFWNSHFPSFHWNRTVSRSMMWELLETKLCKPQTVSEVMKALIKPRAATPCLIGLAPSGPCCGLSLWAFNLDNGDYISCTLPGAVICDLHCRDFDVFVNHKVHIVYPRNLDVNFSSTVCIIIHCLQLGLVKAFLWDLANCHAAWLPSLLFRSSDRILNPLMPYPMELGVNMFSTGLHVYLIKNSVDDVKLLMYRLDCDPWRWKSYPEQSLKITIPVGNVTKPIALLHSSQNSWAYITTIRLFDDSDDTRGAFFRLRPKTRSFKIQRLQSAPFNLRLHRLLNLPVVLSHNQPSKSSGHHRSYLLPIEACARTSSALDFCFDTHCLRWLRLRKSPTSEPSSDEVVMPEGFSSEVANFRGLICITNLGANSADTNMQSRIVMVGRPAQSVDHPEHTSSGIWLVNPTTEKFNGSCPKFSLPPNVTGTLDHPGACCLTTLANWGALSSSPHPVQFVSNPLFSDVTASSYGPDENGDVSD